MESIREIMHTMMRNMKEWTRCNYPDRERINKERKQAEQKKQDEDLAERTAQEQADERTESLEEQMTKEDIQDICSHELSESHGAWRTNISNELLGELTLWMRKRTITAVDK
eukprot:6239458-Heterocapsa_arctica.AAC.1